MAETSDYCSQSTVKEREQRPNGVDEICMYCINIFLNDKTFPPEYKTYNIRIVARVISIIQLRFLEQ